VGAKLAVRDDPRPEISAPVGLLIRLLLALVRILLYPLLALRRLRAAPVGSWVEVLVDGRVPELTVPPRGLERLRRRKPVTSLSDLRELAAELRKDLRPQGLLVTLKHFEGGMAAALALRDILLGLAKNKRRVVVYLPTGADTKGYFIASAATEALGFPQAQVTLLGFASRGVFLKNALSKAGVVAEVIAHGKYKSAGDSLSRDTMSDAQREQSGALLDLMYGTLTRALETRGLSAEEAKAAVDTGVFRTPEAVNAKLLDAALHDDEVGKRLAHEGEPAVSGVSAERYLRARRATRLGTRGRGPCIAVVRVHGAISQGDSPFARGALEHDIIAAVRLARESKSVRGVVLHIDSPGGSALASARMHRELELLASDKPLVACMADVAASGGYYVAAPAHAIIAQPLTITGSIGVIMARFAVGPVLERLGVNVEVLKRGAHADLLDPTRALTDSERAAFAREIEGTYRDFVDVVARGRKKTADEVDAVAQGRVWSGEDALSRGLVDALGGLDVALAEVRRRIGRGGDALTPRVVRTRAHPAHTLDARGKEAALLGIAVDAMSPLLDLLPLVLCTERVLLWAPDAAAIADSA